MGGTQSTLRTFVGFVLNGASLRLEGSLKFTTTTVDEMRNESSPAQNRSISAAVALMPVQCTICLDNFRRPIKVLDCGHSFCSRCLLGWQRRRTDADGNCVVSCPQCRRLSVTPHGVRLATNIDLEEALRGVGYYCTRDVDRSRSSMAVESGWARRTIRRSRRSHASEDDTLASIRWPSSISSSITTRPRRAVHIQFPRMMLPETREVGTVSVSVEQSISVAQSYLYPPSSWSQ